MALFMALHHRVEGLTAETESAAKAHREAQGLEADEIIPVTEGQ